MAAERLTFKVVLLGEGCVGKTSLVLRYCQNIFNDSHKTTLQAGPWPMACRFTRCRRRSCPSG